MEQSQSRVKSPLSTYGFGDAPSSISDLVTISLVFTWAKSGVMGDGCYCVGDVTRIDGLARLQALAA